MSETDNGIALVESELVNPETGKALVKVDSRGQIDVQSLEGLYRLAWMYTKSSIVRDCYRGQKNHANCAVACHTALITGVDLMMFLQYTFVVPGGGKISMEGQLVIAILNNSPAIKGRVRFEVTGTGKEEQCTASATDASTGERHEYTVTWGDVVASRWEQSRGTQVSLWVTQRKLMFRYRSALYLARTAFPDLLMGMQTWDETKDINAADGLQSGDAVPPDGLDAIVFDMAKLPADEQDLQDEAAAMQPTRAGATAKAAKERADELVTDPDEAAKVREAEKRAEEKFVRPDDEPSDVPDDQPELVRHFLQVLSEPDAKLDAIVKRVESNIQLTPDQRKTILDRVAELRKGK